MFNRYCKMPPLIRQTMSAAILLSAYVGQRDNLPEARVPQPNLSLPPHPIDQDSQVVCGQGGEADAGPGHGPQDGAAGAGFKGCQQFKEWQPYESVVQGEGGMCRP